MAAPEITINDVFTGLVFLFAIFTGAGKVWQLFNKQNKVEINKNKEKLESEDNHLKEIAKVVQESNSKYFDAKFDALTDKLTRFETRFEKVSERHEEKIIVNSETNAKHSVRLDVLEHDLSGLGKRVSKLESKNG